MKAKKIFPHFVQTHITTTHLYAATFSCMPPLHTSRPKICDPTMWGHNFLLPRHPNPNSPPWQYNNGWNAIV